MFSITARFRKSRAAGVPGAVYYVIREGRVQRNITGSIRAADAGVLKSARQQIVCDLKSIYCVIEHLAECKDRVTLDDVADGCRPLFSGENPYLDRVCASGERFRIRRDIASVGRDYSSDFETVSSPAVYDGGLLTYIDSLIAGFRLNGKGGASSFRSVRLSLDGFLGRADIPLDEVGSELIMDYSRYLQERVAPSTVSFYMRGLRSVINHARSAGLTELDFDWGANVNISVDHSQKNVRQRSLDAASIRKIADVGLPSVGQLPFVRDMFMFCFYAHGVELIDLANLRKDDFRGGVLSYQRRQKGKRIGVRLGEKACVIIKRYADCEGPMLFPVLQRGGRQYSFSYIRDEFAKAIKEIGQRCGIAASLTFGMSRYSWLAISEGSNVAEMLV